MKHKECLWTKTDKGEIITCPCNKGVVGYVFTKGGVLNIMNAYSDERFNPENDIKSGYKTSTILAGPIFDAGQNIIGILIEKNEIFMIFLGVI